VARDRHPAVAPSPKAVRWSRDRGCNGHRILRRVPADGRHLGSRCGAGFHESAMAVVLAVRGFPPIHLAKARRKLGKHEGRDRSVRGSIAAVPWEENAHVRSPGREAVEFEAARWHDDPPKRSLDVVKRPVPWSLPRGALVSAGPPRHESAESEPGTHEVRVHAVRLGGRCRLDASRVFFTGRSQDLLVTRGR
jgi:hypothetical protein